MDERVSEAFQDLKTYLTMAHFVESIRAGRGVVFILGSDSTCFKLNIDLGRRKGSEACVLYKSST